ncbi:exonuclease [Desulfofundulus thermocisternus]|uniref:exonuclease n=1 Tax=Desulfofundulus thermocisternus TaxID=42471 RepID=UPI00217EEEAB|nr:exonuclease [Desulfofundulus thermocisternus]MCS5696956.1 exonuclease [Desulfofundulus thermocisternus]
MPIHLTFYDGVNCIGGNKFLLEADDTAILLDFGTNFGAEALFFDEFLRPRSITGLCDLLDLGLLPPLRGIYRQDFELPERAWWERMRSRSLYRELEVHGVLLTHAHVDHSGYISFLERSIPVYTSLTTAVIAKAMQDTTHGGFDRETCYITPREIKDGLLQTTHYKKVPYEQRRYVIMDVGQIQSCVADFWARPGSSRAMNCCPLEACCTAEVQVGNLLIKRWPVDHSIPGAGAFGIKTSGGWVIYTGDLRLHGSRAAETRAFMQEAARLEPLGLICEGTHPETKTPVTEDEVFAHVAEAVRRANGLVIADFGPRNIERLLSFLRAARETGRRLAVTLKDAYLLEALHAAGEPNVPNPLEDEGFAFYVEAKARREVWEKFLIERYQEHCRERVVTAGDVSRNQGDYVLCFSYYDLHELIDIQPGSGSYIYSSSEAFNEEMHMDLDRLRNWIKHFNLQLVGDPGDRQGRGREPGFHASGHIHGAGLIELVETVKPKVLIPIHSEDRSFFERHFTGKVKLLFPSPGERVELDRDLF